MPKAEQVAFRPRNTKPKTLTIKIPVEVAPVVAGALDFATNLVNAWPGAVRVHDLGLKPGQKGLTDQLFEVVGDLRRAVAKSKAGGQ